MSPPFPNLLALLASTSLDHDNGIRFLDQAGEVSKELSYADLYKEAQVDSSRLNVLCPSVSSIGDIDVIIASFENHEQHIRLFWACCFAGIPVCPIPPLHTDPTRRATFIEHLHTLFCNPLLVTDDLATSQQIREATPGLHTVFWDDFLSLPLPSADTDGTPICTTPANSSDSIVCLMLTSGSTGNAKAVALRHSNLLSSIYGKIKHHGVASHSNFLNWIAFDHVACVSEVHLQAIAAKSSQFHVSPSAIVQHPFKLLELCSRHHIAYTFSPNFLIAQLCRDQTEAVTLSAALDLSALVALISGGEAVPIQTAIEFANLMERFGAPRNTLRAGFGMSETGAGCVYDTRPIPREVGGIPEKYLSLGKCCEGVDLRIVSRETGEACRSTEPGLLQLRGPTVFREYYNNPQATDESFMAGWFTTGDGAVLDLDGNLHIVGRQKDQININGIKYPTIDVEHFIEAGGIDGVTRSTALVCPMRVQGGDTETYAVFYLHQTAAVHDKICPDDASLLQKCNRAVRHRCILFCSQAPQVVLPLPPACFTRTTLGKVSRDALLRGYLAGEHRALEERLHSFSFDDEPLGPWDQAVANVTAQVIGVGLVPTLSRSTSLFDLGMSSMHLVQLKFRLQAALHIPDIPIIDLLRHPELGQLGDYLMQAGTGRRVTTSESCYNPLVCLTPHGSKPAVFLVHPGVGEVLVFMNLANALEGHPLYALRARGFNEGEELFHSFEEMVDEYVNAIVLQDPEGPYYIGGYSFGGAVAFEMAKLLEAKGRRVAWLGILNLPPFIQSRMRELCWTEVLINLFMFVALIPPSTVDATREMLSATFPELVNVDTGPEASAPVIDWMLSRSDQARLQDLQLHPHHLQQWLRVAYGLTCLGRTYRPTGTIKEAHFTVFCATPLPSMGTRESYKATQLASWRDFTEGHFELVDVDGEHYTMLSEIHVRSFATQLISVLDRASTHLP